MREADFVAAQGIAVDPDGLELNGGEIKAAWPGDDADLAHVGRAHDPAHKVKSGDGSATTPLLCGPPPQPS